MQFLTSRVVFPLSSSMLRRALLTCPIVAVLLLVRVYAEQSKPSANSRVHAPQKDGAERVFATAASKVVFLITRKAGELHARASGIILTADGYIATNYHAVRGADAVEIRFFPDPGDSENYQSFNGAKLLYANAERDIAVLKVNAKSLPFLECSPKTACESRTGQIVYAIGNPMGLNNTMSEGIVSGLRSASGEDVIQHTAAISPGSSGGALLDSRGSLLGMNSWQVADAQNLNFAISAKHVLDALSMARTQSTSIDFPPENSAPSGLPPTEGDSTANTERSVAQQSAVKEMRALVDAIRQCPEVFTNPLLSGAANRYEGPPRILAWDVQPSDSLRQPFEGFVRFDVPVRIEETAKGRQSQKLDQDYHKFVDDISEYERKRDNSISLAALRHRYEFDLSSGTSPELKKAFISRMNKEFVVYEPQANSCWDAIAHSPGSISPKVK
jgi:S1-C subfamily serine protease